MTSFRDSWGVRIRFRAAYYPEGNGIVERSHSTIKRIAIRSKMSIPEAVHWYNVSADKYGASPMDKIYSYPISVKGLRKKNLPAKNDRSERFRIGDKVCLKPPNTKCHTKSQQAIITQDELNQTVEVNGIPRHVKLIRPRNETRSLCIVPDVEIEVGTDACHRNAENHEEQIEDVMERQEKYLKAENGTQEVNVPSRRSARERRMPSKYLTAICLIRKDQGGV